MVPPGPLHRGCRLPLAPPAAGGQGGAGGGAGHAARVSQPATSLGPLTAVPCWQEAARGGQPGGGVGAAGRGGDGAGDGAAGHPRTAARLQPPRHHAPLLRRGRGRHAENIQVGSLKYFGFY